MRKLCMEMTMIALVATAVEAAPQYSWPKEVKTGTYPVTIDKTEQPMMFWTAASKEKRPLLVGLHTWSSDYKQAASGTYARWCIANDWHFIHPHFRGPNWTPDACGSDKVVQDIIDAVEYMQQTYNVDTNRIYLIGASGGGYAALLMAGRAPEIWAGVSAWVPISDIGAWWKQRAGQGYAQHIEKAVGDRPDQSEDARRECVKRSAITYLHNASGVNLDINAGARDGSVPFMHSLYAFNSVVPEKDRMDPSFIEACYRNRALLTKDGEPKPDPLYGKRKVLLRKISKNTRVTIFDGGHEIIHHPGLNWLAQQRKGQPAQWDVKVVYDLEASDSEAQSGK
jgi:pimeloyl-ACP methyl ester carboxylesterase